MWQNAQTLSAGLRVPKPYADYIILDILKQSAGTAIAVTDEQIFQAVAEWASKEGVFAAPEVAASLAAYKIFLDRRILRPTYIVELVNTGSGLKYIDLIAQTKKIAPS